MANDDSKRVLTLEEQAFVEREMMFNGEKLRAYREQVEKGLIDGSIKSLIESADDLGSSELATEPVLEPISSPDLNFIPEEPTMEETAEELVSEPEQKPETELEPESIEAIGESFFEFEPETHAAPIEELGEFTEANSYVFEFRPDFEAYLKPYMEQHKDGKLAIEYAISLDRILKEPEKFNGIFDKYKTYTENGINFGVDPGLLSPVAITYGEKVLECFRFLAINGFKIPEKNRATIIEVLCRAGDDQINYLLTNVGLVRERHGYASDTIGVEALLKKPEDYDFAFNLIAELGPDAVRYYQENPRLQNAEPIQLAIKLAYYIDNGLDPKKLLSFEKDEISQENLIEQTSRVNAIVAELLRIPTPETISYTEEIGGVPGL